MRARCGEGPDGDESRRAQGGARIEARDREEAKLGNKVWLRRRLHATIVREHLEDM